MPSSRCKSKCVFLISPKDLKDGRSYLISKPGKYKLTCNINWQPTSNNSAAIVVASGITNVEIEFQDFALTQSTNSTMADNFGILIESGASNIEIANGSIEGFSASSIKILPNVNTVYIRGMLLVGATSARLVQETAVAGIFAAGTAALPRIQNLFFHNVFVRNITVPATAAFIRCSAIICEYTDNIETIKCRGSYLLNQSSGEPTDPTVDDSNTVIFAYNYCSNTVDRDCTASNNTANSPLDSPGNLHGDCLAMQFVNTLSPKSFNFIAIRNIGTRRTGGIVWLGGTFDFVAENCLADSNTVLNQTDPSVASHNAFECVGGFAAGFPLPQRGVVRDCVATNQPDCFICFGNNVVFDNCKAIAGNTLSTPTVGTFGFQVTGVLGGGNGVTFKNVLAEGFVNDSQAGIYVSGGASNINVIQSKSVKNSVGIRVDSGCTNVWVDDNEVAFNTVFGIEDTAVTTVNLYTRNRAWKNGTNYSGVPPGTIITATNTSLPASVGLENVSIV